MPSCRASPLPSVDAMHWPVLGLDPHGNRDLARQWRSSRAYGLGLGVPFLLTAILMENAAAALKRMRRFGVALNIGAGEPL